MASGQAKAALFDALASVAQALGSGDFRARDYRQMLLFQTIDDAIDVRKDDLFLAVEMQVDGALADSGFGSNVLNGHFAVAKSGE